VFGGEIGVKEPPGFPGTGCCGCYSWFQFFITFGHEELLELKEQMGLQGMWRAYNHQSRIFKTFGD
jgi:hypothetical protein